MLPAGLHTYRDILDRLGEYRVNKTGVTFRCPFGERHERGWDRTPSAGAWLGSGGQLVIRCRACKADFPMFVEHTGVPAHQWFPDRHRWAGLTGERLALTPKRVAAWEYFDADGKWVGTKERFEPGFRGERKTYAWRWPNDEKNDLCPLYRLPEVLAHGAADFLAGELTPVLLCEGEKAADAVVRAGFEATCSPHGSNQWLPVHSAPLEGKRVVLLPDNDMAGLAYADRVAGALARAGVAMLSVAVPGECGYDPPAKGGDAYDWLAAMDQPKGAVADLLDALPVYRLERRGHA